MLLMGRFWILKGNFLGLGKTYKWKFGLVSYEEKFKALEEERADEVEVAA